VVTGSDKVLKWDPNDEGNCDTDATFDLSHLDYGDPDWDVTVKIYNAAGGLVKTLVEEGGFELGPNTVVWDGMADPIPPADPEPAPKGIYTYTVEAVHNVSVLILCRDTDKSTHLSISGASFTEWSIDWDNWEVTAQAGYTLSAAAQDARVRVFAPDFTCIYDSDNDANAVVPTAQGANETGEFTFDLPEGDDAYGAYTVVVDALETVAVAEENNRDQQPKWARQGTATGSVPAHVDLDIAGAGEEIEETVGGVVLLNNDDDNGNDTPDKDETTEVTGEDDLAPISMSHFPSNLASSQIKLEATAGGSKIKVWTAATKGTEVSLPATWSPISAPSTLYVEGFAASGTVRDVTLKLSYVVSGTQEVASDSIKITVVSIDLDIDSDNNNRWGAPDRSPTEEAAEATTPKVIVQNFDDDDSDSAMDCSDGVINGNDDWTYDMAKMVVSMAPGTWDAAHFNLVLSSSDYSLVRVFKSDGTCLLDFGGGEYVLQPSDLTDGLATLGVEGATTGQATLTLSFRPAGGAALWHDDVEVSVIDNLTSLGLAPLYQHKDTDMLCCDPVYDGTVYECATSGDHRWDSSHPTQDYVCPHCGNYCCRASTAMINHFYGGDLSQDRIAYQGRPYWNIAIPAYSGGDLGHGIGLHPSVVLSWALSGDQLAQPGTTLQPIIDCLVSCRPVLIVVPTGPTSSHAMVISGYYRDTGVDYVYVMDPWAGPVWSPFSQLPNATGPIAYSYAPSRNMVPGAGGRAQESSVDSHSDQDGVVDFDEENRFGDFETYWGYQLDKTEEDSGGSPLDDKGELDAFYH